MQVCAILPCRGRAEQTIANVQRLISQAGAVNWQLWLVGTSAEMQPYTGVFDPAIVRVVGIDVQRLTYWQALTRITQATDAPLICNLANDLLPGHRWLERGVQAFTKRFGDGMGLLGFNDGHHTSAHSCHFLIDRDLLTYLGGWPVWYDHAFGDTELCQRAQADRLYAKAPWATLFHDHPYFGGTDDSVYQEGRAHAAQDQALFERRRAQGWPATNP